MPREAANTAHSQNDGLWNGRRAPTHDFFGFNRKFPTRKRLQLHWSNAVQCAPNGGACGPRTMGSIVMRLLSAAVAERRVA